MLAAKKSIRVSNGLFIITSLTLHFIGGNKFHEHCKVVFVHMQLPNEVSAGQFPQSMPGQRETAAPAVLAKLQNLSPSTGRG